MKESLAQRRTALYRFYDIDDALLYAGITHDLEKRWTTHRLYKTWWHLVHRKTAEWYDCRGLAEAAEAQVLTNERPRFDASHLNPHPPLGNAVHIYEDPRKAEVEALLRADINCDTYRQGQVLPYATVLADRYGTSPATISTLFWELAQQHVLEGRGSRWWLRGCRPASKVKPSTVDQTPTI